ncbi:protein NATD1 isoform X1 [Acipenser ruthenus]|uniref:protein NATD1 isoform X1 n=1 Tax=Acipenser ruthenus TaxID=7906 RepID=UPI0027422068|nr:protein NATD1 isoform X1 [Acipenser ruthenus]
MAQASQISALELNCPIKVEHDRKRRQFTVRLNGSHDRAVLLYEYIGKKTVDLQHTEVPDAYRGRGIAKHLAKEVAHLVLKPTDCCSELALLSHHTSLWRSRSSLLTDDSATSSRKRLCCKLDVALMKLIIFSTTAIISLRSPLSRAHSTL